MLHSVPAGLEGRSAGVYAYVLFVFCLFRSEIRIRRKSFFHEHPFIIEIISCLLNYLVLLSDNTPLMDLEKYSDLAGAGRKSAPRIWEFAVRKPFKAPGQYTTMQRAQKSYDVLPITLFLKNDGVCAKMNKNPAALVTVVHGGFVTKYRALVLVAPRSAAGAAFPASP